MNDVMLLTVGPVSVDQAVLDAVGQPVTPHYGKKWITLYNEMLADLQTVFQTSNDTFPITGPGSAAVEMGIGSVAAPGETIITANNGLFGVRLSEFGRARGLNVVEVNASNVEPMTAEHLRPAFEQHPQAVAVAVVHHDTTTGVRNDIASIGRLARDYGALLIVDAVSSMGGVDSPVDEWGIDICVTVANKCLAALPGLSPLSVSPRAWEAVHSKQTSGWYLNLRTWHQYMHDEHWKEWHPYPTTVATHSAIALHTSLKLILDEGLPNVFKRQENVSAAVRSGLRERGFELLLPEEDSSPMMTTAYLLPGMEYAQFSDWLLEEKGLMISGGLGNLSGKVFRVGHMGQAGRLAVAERFLAAVDAFLAANKLG